MNRRPSKAKDIALLEPIENRIHLIRGQRVILDLHLAQLYGVTAGRLMEQVKRNIRRFPSDFMFQLEINELESLKSQFATSNDITSGKINNTSKFLESISKTGAMKGRGGRRNYPYAFTEHGAIMAANVLRSEQAIRASIYIVRAFVQLKKFVATHEELAHKIEELEQQVGTHDKAIVSLFDAIRKMMAAPEPKERKIGFIQDD